MLLVTNTSPCPVVRDEGTVELVSQSGRSANIFIDNASIAVIDTETIIITSLTLSVTCCVRQPLQEMNLITEIAKNAGENYYLYAYDGVYDETFHMVLN